MLFSTATEVSETQGRDEAGAESGAAFIFSSASQGPPRECIQHTESKDLQSLFSAHPP